MASGDLGMHEQSLHNLMQRIQRRKVTPFIGAAASAVASDLPSGAELASSWAERFDYPFDARSLIDIAQYLAVTNGPMFPKDHVVSEFGGVAPPAFGAHDEPHTLLADLNLPIYITTNYDDFMAGALEAQGKAPVVDFCRWNDAIREHPDPSLLHDPGFVPTPEQPVVFHLHGVLDVPESIVISEDDYLSFIADLSLHRDHLLPPVIQQALTGSSLMFMGYGLSDWDFKVIFQALVISMEPALRRRSVAVQLHPDDRQQKGYLAEYMDQKSIDVFWGDLSKFIAAVRSGISKLAEASPST